MKSIVDYKYEKQQTFIVEHKRLSHLFQDIMVPGTKQLRVKKPAKYDMLFYVDVSGSCAEYARRFFEILKSVPQDDFSIRFYTFNTYVNEVSLQAKSISTGGGTSFNCIQRSVNTIAANDEKYPDLVFVVTDGYGDYLYPHDTYGDRWHWMLTDHSSTHCIQSFKNIHYIRDLK
jgi:hypothetical protein